MTFLLLLMVRRRFCAASNHDGPVPLILRDAAKTPLLRMRKRVHTTA
jgi:hypothetical protein